MKAIKKAIRKWLGITESSTYPHRFVQLMYWQDRIIGVDGNGDLYFLDPTSQNGIVIQLWVKNPLER